MADLAITPFDIVDSGDAASLHRLCFASDPWPEKAFISLLATGAEGFVTRGANIMTGLILVRAASDEAEILTFAVAPVYRRHGIGRILLNKAIESLQEKAIVTLFLEVGKTNYAAFDLYRQAGFITVAERNGYYTGPDGISDAYVMMKPITAKKKLS